MTRSTKFLWLVIGVACGAGVTLALTQSAPSLSAGHGTDGEFRGARQSASVISAFESVAPDDQPSRAPEAATLAHSVGGPATRPQPESKKPPDRSPFNVNDRVYAAWEELEFSEFKTFLDETVAEFKGDPAKQAEALYAAYSGYVFKNEPDEWARDVLKRAFERIELARLRVLGLRLRMYAAHARDLVTNGENEEYLRTYEEAVRLFDEVQLYSHRLSDESRAAYKGCATTYQYFVVQLLRARNAPDIDDRTSHLAGRAFYPVGFRFACEYEPLFVQYVYCISDKAGKRQVDALSWLTDVLAGKDVFASSRPPLDDATREHLRAVKELIEQDIKQYSDKVRSAEIPPGVLEKAKADDEESRKLFQLPERKPE